MSDRLQRFTNDHLQGSQRKEEERRLKQLVSDLKQRVELLEQKTEAIELGLENFNKRGDITAGEWRE